MTAEKNVGGPVVWTPTTDVLEQANLTRFMRSNNLTTYAELMRRSIKDPAWFTHQLLQFLEIQFYEPYQTVLDLSRGIEWPRWCVGGEMNIVHNCLDKRVGEPIQNQLALVWEGEDGQTRTWTYRELTEETNRVANMLQSLEIGKGDVIGLFMPMVPEIVSAFLAIAKIGGIILPLFSGYGTQAVRTRLIDSGAKALFTADGFYRRGKPVELKSVADEAAAGVESLKYLIIYRRTNLPLGLNEGRDLMWDQVVPSQSVVCSTVHTMADDPLMLIYTSGTTGRPKGAVHTHCGFPVKVAQDMAFGTDVHPGDVVYWMTDMGWMMGPWLVFGSLLLGASFLLYEGAPDYPRVDRLWSLIERHKVTMLGISPTLIRALAPHGQTPVRRHNLSSLRIIASTGETWNPDPWNWLFEVVGEKKRPVINYSGGTEIGGGILMGNPILPIKPCGLSAACPGMEVEVYNDKGESVRGEVGELVVKTPWIGMTRGFWQDPERYLQTYWSRWEGVWVHGDYAIHAADGMWYIQGRSDDTLKIAGKRIGPAEIENILVDHPAIVEAAAIGIPHPVKGEEVVVFCVPASDVSPASDLLKELREAVTHALGKPFTPREILFTPELPKTHNGKVMRRMARLAFLAEHIPDTSTMLNPACLDALGEMGHRFRETS